MSDNYQAKLRKADINISATGDNIVITPGTGEMPAAWDNPATLIAIDFISFIPSASVTIQLKSGSTNYGGPLSVVAQQPLTWENAVKSHYGVITLAPNQNFVINLSGPVQLSGFIRYRILNEN